jgi:hypothetical protein
MAVRIRRAVWSGFNTLGSVEQSRWIACRRKRVYKTMQDAESTCKAQAGLQVPYLCPYDRSHWHLTKRR